MGPLGPDAYRDVLRQELTKGPTLRSVELLHRVRHAGYTGGKSAVYALAHSICVHVTALVRVEGWRGNCMESAALWVSTRRGGGIYCCCGSRW